MTKQSLCCAALPVGLDGTAARGDGGFSVAPVALPGVHWHQGASEGQRRCRRIPRRIRQKGDGSGHLCRGEPSSAVLPPPPSVLARSLSPRAGGSGAPVLPPRCFCAPATSQVKKVSNWCAVGVRFLPFSSWSETLGRDPGFVACFVMELSSGTG